MLNPFPELLDLRFFAPTLIRLAAAGVLLFAAFCTWKRRKQIAETGFPIIGKVTWVAPISALFHAVLAFMLGAGYYTQIAAILGGLGAIKSFFLAKRYPALVPLSRPATVLLFFMLLSLLISGAGALAFDLPL